MQQQLRAGSVACDYDEPGRSPWADRRNKFALAGAAVVTASALAITPVTVMPATPALPDAHPAAVELSAFENPLALWGTTISNTLTTTGGLGHNIVEQMTALGESLGNPALHAEIVDVVMSSLTNPLSILSETLMFPFTYGGRIGAGIEALSSASSEAFSKLPAALLTSLGYLAQGQFLAAYGQINNWFLVDALSTGRAGLLDALRVPGDFLESIGLDPLARILGTSWMDEGTAGPGYGAGLLSRGVIGNLGRALFAPGVTAIFQTVEILDRAREALLSGDFVTLASEILNAPAKITNAFLNGYVPAFVDDPDSPFPPDGPGRNFPGLFSPTGTLDFFFVQIPREIARALNLQRPESTTETTLETPAPLTAVSSTDVALSSDSITLDVDPVVSEKVSAPDPEGDASGIVVHDEVEDEVTDDTDTATGDTEDSTQATEDATDDESGETEDATDDESGDSADATDESDDGATDRDKKSDDDKSDSNAKSRADNNSDSDGKSDGDGKSDSGE
ncbi:Uncharacterised protein [Mycolicibacterium vanbaalenii]|uniref:PE-PGRS family protein n=1 Tax=Mycolicibacterium vanbaalenii TaxID=110539 RepID=A0A5S9R824_MYCVN|nr:hypothetical protein [Mycolicibacterium vanbaalenii]CAA0134698.1 Uncharacterised protein [Mycolicibacterium vanbaalenii]